MTTFPSKICTAWRREGEFFPLLFPLFEEPYNIKHLFIYSNHVLIIMQIYQQLDSHAPTERKNYSKTELPTIRYKRNLYFVIEVNKKICLLRCFDTVFQRPYRNFSIALTVNFSLSDRYKIFTSNWLWIGICENVVLSKIDITLTTMNKKR